MWRPRHVRLANGSTLYDNGPGHAIMEVLGLYAEDEGIPRWRRRAEGMHVPERPEKIMVNPEHIRPDQPSLTPRTRTETTSWPRLSALSLKCGRGR